MPCTRWNLCETVGTCRYTQGTTIPCIVTAQSRPNHHNSNMTNTSVQLDCNIAAVRARDKQETSVILGAGSGELRWLRDSVDAATKGWVLQEVSKEPVEFKRLGGRESQCGRCRETPFARSHASTTLMLQMESSGLSDLVAAVIGTLLFRRTIEPRFLCLKI